MSNILEVENVTKKIRDRAIVENVSFHIQEGEVVGLVGPNGAGKTTIMRMITGLIRMNEGSIRIDGKDLQKSRIESLEKIGAVIETPQLYPYLSGYDNLKILSGLHGRQYEKNILSVAKLVQLEDSIYKRTGGYSLGMRQRLGVAQALIHSPRLVILDEPLNGLDPIGVKQVREYLRNIAQAQKVAILISSHILSEIELICNRIVLLDEGKKISEITVNEEQTNREFKMFLGVDNPDKAFQIVRDMGYRCEKTGIEEIVVTLRQKKETADIIQRLTEQQVEVYFAERHRESLEDKFIETFGEKKHA